MDEINEALSLLKPAEVPVILRAVTAFEKGGLMTPAEAAEWRFRIEAWEDYLALPDDSAPM